MAKITYVEHGNGQRHTLELETGSTVMQGAVDQGIPGIEALCGGSCSCSTCHVYVDPQWIDKLEPQDEIEKQVLEQAPDLRPTSRLSCQIEVTDALDGLVVHMPAEQAV